MVTPKSSQHDSISLQESSQTLSDAAAVVYANKRGGKLQDRDINVIIDCDRQVTGTTSPCVWKGVVQMEGLVLMRQ
jgi:hypothetical protein